MGDSGLSVEEWETHFLNHYTDIETEEKREMASLALCFLLCSVIRPMIYAGDEKFLDFEDALTEILETTLPAGENAGAFIEEYENDLTVIMQIQKKLELVDQMFTEASNDLYVEANRVNQQIVDNFESLKETLKAIVENRKALSKESYDKIESLKSKIEGILTTLGQNQIEVEEIGRRLETEENHFLSLLSECQTLLMKV